MRLALIFLATAAAACTPGVDPDIIAQCEKDGMGSRAVCECFERELRQTMSSKAFRATGFLAREQNDQAEEIMKAMTPGEAADMVGHSMGAMQKCRIGLM
jgi:hypothetical protein